MAATAQALRVEAVERPTRLRLRLVALSFLMLFVELALIRWTGAHVLYLSYFSNFVLLGSFLGIGLGFMRAEARTDLFRYAPVGLAFLVAFVLVFPVEIDRSGGQLIYFGTFQRTGLPAWLTLPLIFTLVACVMMMLAEGVARTFVKFPPLEAYRLDIVGSLAGIGAFTALSFLELPPVAWGLVFGCVYASLWGRRATALQLVALISLVLMTGRDSMYPNQSWSPYYRITTWETGDGRIDVAVNGIPHQAILPLSRIRGEEPVYVRPYEIVSRAPRWVLVIGAGTGNDVAVALDEGARRVVAVEIDPALYRIGVERHPARPYLDPRVQVVIDDGRAYLERSDERFDLIVFALPDSLTLVSGQAQIRLESYLFTREAMVAARDHLAAHGTFAMYNYYREPWLVDRLTSTLAQVYGHPPCVEDHGPGALALIATSLDPGQLRCPAWEGGAGPDEGPVPDDRPFVYLRGRAIPLPYVLTLVAILAVSFLSIRLTAGASGELVRYLDLFFMGAAFLLLETKSVVTFALLFGSTWLVNALVFGGILLAVFAAVEVSRRRGVTRPRRLYAALLVALAVAWAIPSSVLLSLPVGVRLGAAVTIAFAPVFLANVVFAQRFREVEGSAGAFGANLLGAILGGVLEYASLAVGYRNLLVLAALLYLCAFVSWRKPVAHRLRGRAVR